MYERHDVIYFGTDTLLVKLKGWLNRQENGCTYLMRIYILVLLIRPNIVFSAQFPRSRRYFSGYEMMLFEV